jgi:Protein of unknown function (DUF3140)
VSKLARGRQAFTFADTVMCVTFSGRKIVDILKRNPKKQADKYTDEDLAHMKKVVAYCARHIAQEDHMKQTKSPDELEQTKSTKSLKNWGHDPLKTL